jgi:hypothetical protein
VVASQEEQKMGKVDMLRYHGLELESGIVEVDRLPWPVEDNSGPGVLVTS